MDKLMALFRLFRQGEAVENPEAWHNLRDAAGVLTAFLVALVAALQAFGVDLQLTQDQLGKIGLGLAALVGAFPPVVRLITDRRIGFPAATLAGAAGGAPPAAAPAGDPCGVQPVGETAEGASAGGDVQSPRPGMLDSRTS